MAETYVLNIVTPVASASLNGVEEFELELPNAFGMLYVAAETVADGNPDWGMPSATATTVTVAAEVWRDGMDDDGDGEPVTSPEGLAALLGCAPGNVARHVYHELLVDRWVGREESRLDR
jgi:hypothetical protein